MINPGELAAKPDRRWRLSQAAAVALLLALALCVTLVITLPLNAARSGIQDSIDLLTERLTALQRAASHRHALEAQLAGLGDQLDQAKILLQGKNATIAGAWLQDSTKRIITGARGNLQSIEVRAVSDSGSLEKIELKARFTGEVESLQATLHMLESFVPWILVEDVTIQSRGNSVGKGHNDPSARTPLDVSLGLAAYRRTGGET